VGEEVGLYSFSILALGGGGWSAPRPGRFPLYRRLGGPQDRSGQMRKSSPPPEFDPRTVQPVASRYTDWATRPIIKHVHIQIWVYRPPPNTYIPNYMSVHISPQPILIHSNSVHFLAPYFIKTDIYFILPSTPSSSCLAQISEPKILCAFLFSVNGATCAAHIIPKNTWWGVQILKLLIMEFSQFPCYSSITWQSILSTSPFNLCYAMNVTG
jgi:hypothetical protein